MKKFRFVFAGIFAILIVVTITGFMLTKNSAHIDITYITKTCTIQNEINKTDIIIEYPFFTAPEGININQLNELVYKQSVKTQLEKYDNKTGLYYKGKYSIKLLDKEYASILFESESYLDGSAYPVDNGFGLTYNVKKNKTEDLYEIIEKSNLDKIIDAKNFKVVKAVNDFLTDPAFEYYMHVDSSSGFYLTDDSFGLIFSLPHVAGDYATVETHVSKNLKLK